MGKWARLLGGRKRVVLALVDSVTGIIFPPVVVSGEEGVTCLMSDASSNSGMLNSP